MSAPELDFRTFFEAAPGALVVLSKDFTVAAVNDAYLAVANNTREKVVGKKFFDLFADPPDEQGSTIKMSLEKVLQTREMDTMATKKQEMLQPDGSIATRYWASCNKPILGSSGEVAYIVRRLDDFTKSVHQAIERKAIEQERDLFFTHAFDLMGIVSTDGYFKRVNPAFELTLGYLEQELRAKPLVEFLHPDDVEKTKKGIRTLASGTPTTSSVNRYRCKNGGYKWFSWNTTPLGDRLYAIGRDITEQISSEGRIRELMASLEQKNEDLEFRVNERMKELKQSEAQVQQLQKMDAVGRLAGGIAHDFNNMLGAISIYCDMIHEDSENPQTVRQNISEVREATSRAAALTRQLLIFSRKQVIQYQTISLNPLIQQLEKMLVRLIGKNIKLTSKLADNLHLVKADASQLEQVILNLVVNAKDAMPEGGTVTVETSNVYLDEAFTSTHLSVNRGHYVLLSISDTGTGMDASTLSKIFEPFYTTKPVGKGTGMGLTTTYGIIKQSKGTIWVYSEVGRGTVFKIYLPIDEKEDSPLVDLVRTAPASSSAQQTILLVEDDDKLREGFSFMLQRRGYHVLAAASGNQALKLCESYLNPIDLLLTDMVMPGLSGIELGKKILAIRPNLPILYMSGYTNDALENAGKESMDYLTFIQKPFDTTALVSKVEEVLTQAQRK